MQFTMDMTMMVATAGGDRAASSAVAVNNMWDFLVKGGPVMIPIVLCSLIATAVVVERLVSLRRSRIIPAQFLSGLKAVLQAAPGGAGWLEAAKRQGIEYCRAKPSPTSNIFIAGLKRLGESSDSVQKHMQEAGERELFMMRKHLRVLSIIGSVAPLLGLLGTITGMITAFQTVASSAEALGQTELLAKGIYEAMITTAAGLIVAIPVILCFQWVNARIDRHVLEIDGLSREFLDDDILREAADHARTPAASRSTNHEMPTAPRGDMEALARELVR